MKPPEHIETGRLILRKPRPEDANAMFAGWAQDTEVTRYLTRRPHKSIEESHKIIKLCLKLWEGEGDHPYMLTLKENDHPIGMLALHPDVFCEFATCDVENLASARVVEKAGMTREGLLRRYIIHPNISGEQRDCYLYAIVK